MLKKIKKNVEKNNTLFNPEMYNNTLGSLIITHYILHLLETGEKLDTTEINRKWKTLRKKGCVGDKELDFWLEDIDFISKALDLFDMKPNYGNFCMVQSAFNTLFLPYIDEQPMPIREDGFMPMSATQGKIYPIVDTTDVDKTEEKEEK